MSATANLNVKDVLLAEQLDVEAVLALGHQVRQFKTIRDEAEGAAAEITSSSKPERDARVAAINWMLGNQEQAQSHALKDAASPVALMICGLIAEKEGNLSDALKFYNKAASKAPTSSSCVLSPLGVMREMGKREEVLGEIEKLEREFGDKPELHMHKGKCLQDDGLYDEALECYSKGLELDPDHPGTLFCAASLLDQRGQDEQAIELYKRIGPGAENSYSNAFLNLATLYEDNNNYEEAIHCCEMVIAHDPMNKRAKMLLESAEASISMFYSPEETKQSEKLEAILRVPVTDFELSVRSRNCLAKMNIRSLGDLVKRTESEMLAYKNFGETSLREIRDMLVSRNLRLGMLREDAATRAAFSRSNTRQREEIRNKPIDELELSVRSRKCMDRLGVSSIGELCDMSELDLATAKNFGRVSLNEIKKRLQENNLSLRQD